MRMLSMLTPTSYEHTRYVCGCVCVSIKRNHLNTQLVVHYKVCVCVMCVGVFMRVYHDGRRVCTYITITV